MNYFTTPILHCGRKLLNGFNLTQSSLGIDHDHWFELNDKTLTPVEVDHGRPMDWAQLHHSSIGNGGFRSI